MFSFGQGRLEMHKNLMTCVIIGHKRSVCVADDIQSIEADIICIKPGVGHSVAVQAGGADIYYFDGLRLPETAPSFIGLNPEWRALRFAFDDRDHTTVEAFRQTLVAQKPPPDQGVMGIVSDLYSRPFERLPQTELAQRLGLERTQALRHFKATTGQTFRKFKIWAAMVAAARSAYGGERIGLAGIEAGFSDAAHLARTAKQTFGLTPTDGIAGLKNIQTLG
jgi:AraC-like DNA-binding protein